MNGWLSPEGKFFECPINGHLEKAKELFLSDNPELSLEKTHWLKITPYHIFASVSNDFQNDSDNLTQKQIDFLWDNVVNCNECFDDLREMANYILTGSFKINVDE